MVQSGDVIDVVILDFDENSHKLSLGHKQLTPNPWDELEAKYPVGTVVDATVSVIGDKNTTLTLADGTEVSAFNRELTKEDGKAAIVGETLPVKVVDLRRSTRTVRVSHVRTYQEAKAAKETAEAEGTKKAIKKVQSNVEKTTLGDISALAALKEQLEKGE
jgi:small subunit ribosomal protein S1